MKKKFFIAVLVAMAIAVFSLAACAQKTETPLVPVADIPDAATVEVGSLFDFETAAVAKGSKVYSPQEIKITFGENENVTFTGTSFTPAKVGVYTVTYKFDIDGEAKTFTTAVTAQDTTKPSIILSSDIPVRVEKGAYLTLPEFQAVDICDGTLTADVKVYENTAAKTPIIVSPEKQFRINSDDGVVIEATATDAAGNKAEDKYTVAVRGEREVDYFDNEPYAVGNSRSFGGGIVEYNANTDHVIQGKGSLKFYTDVNGMYVFCGFPSINEAVQTAGGKNAFKNTFSAVTMLLYNASPYDCEIELQYWKENAQESNLTQDAQLIQKNTLVANCWTKISVPTGKIADAYADGVFYGMFFNGAKHTTNKAYANFCVYVDCMRLSKSTDTAEVTVPVENITQKATGSTDVQLIALSALERIDLTKLAVTAKDKNENVVTVEKTADAYVLKNVNVGQYAVQYMYANGENIDVFSQVVTLYAPLDDEYFDGFEGGGYTHTLTPLSGSPAVEISTEQAHSGTHALKVTTGIYRYTQVPLMLDPDMLDKIKSGGNNVELSVWVYIAGNNGTEYGIRLNSLKKDNGRYVEGTLTKGGYGNKDGVPTGQWLQVLFSTKEADNDTITQIKQYGGIVLNIEIRTTASDESQGESSSYPFTYYVDDLEVISRDTTVTMNPADMTVKYEDGKAVTIADLSDGAKFSGVDKNKLSITCDSATFTYVIEGNSIKFTPAAAGVYNLTYTHRNGHTVATATQTVTIRMPLTDPYLENFESNVGVTVSVISSGTNVPTVMEVSNEQHRSGSKSYKVVNNTWGGGTTVKFTLPEEMREVLTSDAELSFWVYIASMNENVSTFNTRALVVNNSGGAGGWFSEGNQSGINRADGLNKWYQFKCRMDNENKLQSIIDNGAFVFILEMTSSTGAVDYTYYLDDIEVTKPDANVTITAQNKTVAKDTSAEIAQFSGSNFNAQYLTVTKDGQPYTYTLSGNKLSFTPTAVGEYVFVYTHKNGHMVNTVTQTVTVCEALSNPLFDGFEEDAHATVLQNTIDGTELSNRELFSNGSWDHPSHSGNKMYQVRGDAEHNINAKVVLLQLNPSMTEALQVGDTLSFWLYMNVDTSNQATKWVTNASVYTETSGGFTETNIKCDGYGEDKKSSLTKKSWYQVSISLANQTAVDTLKASRTIGISIDLAAPNVNFEYFIDDIQVTHAA